MKFQKVIDESDQGFISLGLCTGQPARVWHLNRQVTYIWNHEMQCASRTNHIVVSDLDFEAPSDLQHFTERRSTAENLVKNVLNPRHPADYHKLGTHRTVQLVHFSCPTQSTKIKPPRPEQRKSRSVYVLARRRCHRSSQKICCARCCMQFIHVQIRGPDHPNWDLPHIRRGLYCRPGRVGVYYGLIHTCRQNYAVVDAAQALYGTC